MRWPLGRVPPTFALSTSAVNDRNQSARGRRESATRGSSIVNSTCAQLANSTCVQLARGTLGGALLRAKRSCAPGMVKVGRRSDDHTCRRGRAGQQPSPPEPIEPFLLLETCGIVCASQKRVRLCWILARSSMYASDIDDENRPRRRQKNGAAFSLASLFRAPGIPFEQADNGTLSEPVCKSVRRVPDELRALH